MDELRFVSREPIRLSEVYDQLWQYATQGADPSAFEPMREPIKTRAAAFEKRLVEVGPDQVAAIVEFAEQAWRRPLTEGERAELSALYDALRNQDLFTKTRSGNCWRGCSFSPRFCIAVKTRLPVRIPRRFRIGNWRRG